MERTTKHFAEREFNPPFKGDHHSYNIPLQPPIVPEHIIRKARRIAKNTPPRKAVILLDKMHVDMKESSLKDFADGKTTLHYRLPSKDRIIRISRRKR